MNDYTDTIAAIATPLSSGAISIIKVSGQDAIAIVNKIFKGKDLTKVLSHTIHYGHIINNKENQEIIDEVLISVYKAPKTFTKEDVVEVNCHGGIYVTNRILELIILNGARIAEAGEFTKRAFLNGRIDFTQAEAVMDIISSNTTASLKMANYGLLGETKKVIQELRNEVLQIILQIEVNIDYPEYEDEEQMTLEQLVPSIRNIIEEIDNILNNSSRSKILKYGIKTAIIGKPNVGKSSLLNALLREEKAIVTNIAGTTRDIVEGSINLNGVVLNLIDTAGVREASDIVEKIGVEKTKKVLEEADLIILVFDYNNNLNDIDYELLKLTQFKNRIIVVNKKDLHKNLELDKLDNYLLVSSFEKEDIDNLEKVIKEVCEVENLNNIDPTYIGNERQITKLKMAKENLITALDDLHNKLPIDIANIEITNAWQFLGEILGDNYSDEMIDELFSRFCLGK